MQNTTVHNQDTESDIKQMDKLAMLGQLSASIAHEIRNPLAGISTIAQVLRGKLDDDRREFVDVILSEINRLDNIVRELLDFASPSRSFMQSCNIHDVIERALRLVDTQLVKSEIKLKKDYIENARAGVCVDAERIMQAFLNILLNAVAAMPKGGDLTIKTLLAEDMVQIQFADSGPGISVEKLDDLFKPFF